MLSLAPSVLFLFGKLLESLLPEESLVGVFVPLVEEIEVVPGLAGRMSWGWDIAASLSCTGELSTGDRASETCRTTTRRAETMRRER